MIEQLGDEHMISEPVDLASVQFLRDKQRPGWRLFEVAFQEIDGEQKRMIFVLEQNEDDSWRWHSSGSSSDIEKQWPKAFTPVRDHPLIFLNAGWTLVGNQQYLRTAYGVVIDNGFQVARVRLTNAAGQTLEDTVEDGYVFFACKPEEQIQLPMQAELSDRQGKLVWRQQIPDEGLPPWIKIRHRHQ